MKKARGHVASLDSSNGQVYFVVEIPSSDLIYEVMPNGGLSIRMPVSQDGDLLGEALRVDLEILRQSYELSPYDLDIIGDGLVDLVLSRVVLRRIGDAIAHRER